MMLQGGGFVAASYLIIQTTCVHSLFANGCAVGGCLAAWCALTVFVLPRSCVMQDYSRLLRDNAPVGSK
jgi:hypothetical protein